MRLMHERQSWIAWKAQPARIEDNLLVWREGGKYVAINQAVGCSRCTSPLLSSLAVVTTGQASRVAWCGLAT